MFCIGRLVEYNGTARKDYCGRISDIIPRIGKDVIFKLNETSKNSALRKNTRKAKLKPYVVFNLKNYKDDSSALLPDLVSLLNEVKHEALYYHIKTNKLEGKEIDWIIQKYCIEDERKAKIVEKYERFVKGILENEKTLAKEAKNHQITFPKLVENEIPAKEETEKTNLCQNRSLDEGLNDKSARIIQSYINFLRARHVKYFVHFTPVENIESIMKNGLCPRAEQNMAGKTTDNLRLDAMPEALSLSISFPNYQMFYKKRNEMASTDFVVLKISIDSLKEFNPEQIGFYADNAASAKELITSFDEHCTLDSLRNMFAVTCKRKGDLPYEYTTNPQAEIMIKGIIPVKYIDEVVFEKQTVLRKYWYKCSCLYSVDSSLYKYRCDFDVWKKQNDSESQNAEKKTVRIEVDEFPF